MSRGLYNYVTLSVLLRYIVYNPSFNMTCDLQNCKFHILCVQFSWLTQCHVMFTCDLFNYISLAILGNCVSQLLSCSLNNHVTQFVDYYVSSVGFTILCGFYN